LGIPFDPRVDDVHAVRLLATDARRERTMPGLMSRMSLIFKSKFSKALDKAENPNETLDYSYEQQLQANREDLAREALTRKAAVQSQLQDIMTQGQQLEAQQQKLVEGERAL